ncbi:ORC2-like protein [Alternaria alternata]|nr:ORC2-like protein [Alternaria alternata]
MNCGHKWIISWHNKQRLVVDYSIGSGTDRTKVLSNPPWHLVPVALNSIGSSYLRKTPVPSMLARIAATHPSIDLLYTADTPYFAPLFDAGMGTQHRLLFHDAITSTLGDVEMGPAETVNELLGRSNRRIGGRDSLGSFLSTLPEQVQELFRIFITEQLALSLMEGGGLGEKKEVTATPRPEKVENARNVLLDSAQGVVHRAVYHKAVEAFVCRSGVSSKDAAQGLHDRQVVESRKDVMGTERLWMPFEQGRLESLAEDVAEQAL